MSSEGHEDEARAIAPRPVNCATCRRELPQDQALTPEGGDYTLWFCGIECYAQWRREQGSDRDG
jgi:hypothetical protein